MRWAPAFLTFAVAAALMPGAAASAAPAGKRCLGGEFACSVLTVPLDHSGGQSGTLGLRYAVEVGGAGNRPPLLALAGGPGQGAVAFGPSFGISLQSLLGRYRLVVLDQRGTGASGALDCPAIQRLDALDPVSPVQIGACAQRVGLRRAFYSTADSVADIDALREALGAPKLAIFGISYGTYVAQQYARAHPDHVDSLVLDSVVRAGGVDPYLMDSYRYLPRLLREQCAHGACRGITTDPVADVATLARILENAPLRGTERNAKGGVSAVTLRGPDELSNLLTAGDLNPLLQPALPGAISSAVRGDRAPLLRLLRIGAGPPDDLKSLSEGLNVTTACEDVRLPYPLTAPPVERQASSDQALAAIAPSEYAPFGIATIRATSYAEDCLQWPQDVTAQPFDGPLPDVPTLLFSGRLDSRTPFEGAREVASLFPHGELVPVPGTGHDELDNDITGCTITALRRFAARKAVGDPCKNVSNQIPPFPRAPNRLREFRRAPGVTGDRGRVVFAVIDTAIDARITALQQVFAGFSVLGGGGLRAGTFTAKLGSSGAVLRVRRYSYLAGVRITGTLRLAGSGLTGKLTVAGPGKLDGVLTIDSRGGVRGRLGGKAVRYRPKRSAAAAARLSAPSLPWRIDVPWALLKRRLTPTPEGHT